VLCICVVDDSKLAEQEARERASTDQLTSTDIRTREFENMVHLYKYVMTRSLILSRSRCIVLLSFRCVCCF